jgi:hypothetical protein
VIDEVILVLNGSDKDSIILSPLADPVITAIFENVEVAGKAADSLIRAVLSEGEGVKFQIGEIISVTPQRTHSEPGSRGCRVDVEIITDKNEKVIVEVQLSKDRSILQRNLLTGSRIFSGSTEPGTSTDYMRQRLPKVIAINILNDNIRADNLDIVQPISLSYEKDPRRTAIEEFAIYNVQLSRFREIEPDFDNPLHCWLYTLDTSHSKGKTIKEVIDMTPTLQAFAKQDEGFKQFCERYGIVAEDPESRERYFDYINYVWKMQGIQEAAYEDGYEAASKTIILDMARNLKKQAILSNSDIAKATNLPIEIIEKL